MRRTLLIALLLGSSCVGVSNPDDCDGQKGDRNGMCLPVSPTPSPTAIPRVSYMHPSLRWLIAYPEDWHLQPFQTGCGVSSTGAVVTNVNRDLGHIPVDEPPECTIEWDLTEVPEGFVGVEIARIVGGPPPPFFVGPDTELPVLLDAESLEPLEPLWVRPGMTGTSLRLVFNGDPGWHVRVWAEPSALEEDLAEAGRIVASLNFVLSEEERRRKAQEHRRKAPFVSPRRDIPGESKTDIKAAWLEGQRLFVHFTGNPCAAILSRVDIVETPSSATVTLWTGWDPRVKQSGGKIACTLQGALLNTEVPLERSLSDRTLTDGSTGKIVQVENGP